MAKRFVDIHCHPTMKPYSKSIINRFKATNNKDARVNSSIWHTNSYIGEEWRKEVERFIGAAKYKQADMTKLEDGDAELVIISLSSPEVGFLDVDRNQITGITRIAFSDDGLINFVAEFGKARANEIRNSNFSYFNDLQREYDYVLQLDNVKTLQGKKYRLAKRGENITQLIENNPETIIVVLSIEGAHALLPFASDSLLNQYTPFVDNLNHPSIANLLNELIQNITIIKSWGQGSHCPLFLTLSHHFWNLVAGHAPSLAGKLTLMLDQTNQINRGMTELGKVVVEQLLSTQNGSRILIDMRHMSVEARRWYINYISVHNTNNPSDTIPLISSHSASNGFGNISDSWLSEVYYDNRNTRIIANEKYKNSNIFNNWSINISDEEAINIFQSEGLIGISMDQRVLSGKNQLIKARRRGTKSAWAELFFNQISHFYHLFYNYSRGNARRAISTLCIGSDFDGIINPIDYFGTARDFNFLKQELYRYILDAKMNPNSSYRFPDISAEDVVEGVMYNSAKQFIEKWFVN